MGYKKTCVACKEKGVNAFADVCSICGTNQIKYIDSKYEISAKEAEIDELMSRVSARDQDSSEVGFFAYLFSGSLLILKHMATLLKILAFIVIGIYVVDFFF